MTDPLLITPVTRPIDATVRVPGSKSITNRALILAALADGPSTLGGALYSDDTRYMAESLRRLGIAIAEVEAADQFVVSGAGGKIPAHEADLFIGNSGTSVRFLTALAALGHGRYRLDGIERMRQRPIQDLLDALGQLGVDASTESGNGCPPVILNASGLRGGVVRMSADISSQFLSAILMVAPLAQGDVEIELTGPPVSWPYIQMTINVMGQWGANVDVLDTDRYHIPGGQQYRAQTYPIEPDASSASYFFAAAAATGGRVRVQGLTRQSLQGDVAFADLLGQMGCEVHEGEDYLEVHGPWQLHGVEVDMEWIPDTAMTLAAIAPFADSPTTITGIANIRYKETDRLAALINELGRLGVSVEELPDGLTIYPAKELRPAEIETYDDHRMAMSFAVTGLKSPGTSIKNPLCVNKTFPDFFDRLFAICRN